MACRMFLPGSAPVIATIAIGFLLGLVPDSSATDPNINSGRSEIDVAPAFLPPAVPWLAFLDRSERGPWFRINSDTLLIPVFLCRTRKWRIGDWVRVSRNGTGRCMVEQHEPGSLLFAKERLYQVDDRGVHIPFSELGDCWERSGVAAPSRNVGDCFVEVEPWGRSSLSVSGPLCHDYFLGTDGDGFSVAHRLLGSAHTYLAFCLACSGLAVLLGTVLSVGSSYSDRNSHTFPWMVLAQSIDACPRLILVLVVGYVAKFSTVPLFLVLGISMATRVARVLSVEIVSLKRAGFIEAAHEMGLSDIRIVIRHILVVKCSHVLLRQFTFGIGDAILVETTANYLVQATTGLDLAPKGLLANSWGCIVAQNRKAVFDGQWWTLAPVLTALVASSMLFWFLGEYASRRLRLR